MPDFGGPRDGVARDKQKTSAVVPQGPALVTPEEKDELGWENPDAMLNSELQRLAMANREQIYSIVQPYVERTLRRQVEMTGISATYPYQSVDVEYRTVDEPYVAGWEFVALEDDGSLKSEAHISPESGVVIEYETAAGLYLMAYRDRIAEIREYITTAHPHFTQLPDGYIRAWRIADPMLKCSFYGSGPGKGAEVRAAEEAIYQAFQERPDRTDA